MTRPAHPIHIGGVLLFGLAACGDSAPLEPPDLLARIHLTAEPDVQTLRAGDTVALEVRDSLGAVPETVEWTILPGDSGHASSPTFIFRPTTTGEFWIRAEAAFADGRRGDAARAFNVEPNAAPVVQVVGVGGEPYLRVPLGETITVLVEVDDPDDPPGSHTTEWLERLDGQPVPLASGDTLRLLADATGVRDLIARVRDPHGAYALRGYYVEVYDSAAPPAWRAVRRPHPDRRR